nr:hypothetical protein [Tanacetum cinerariifolium]
MSLASSAVTYTFVYTDYEPGRVFWGAEEELSDGGSPRVILYGYDGLHMLPVSPPSPYYIHGPEEPQTPPAPYDEDEDEHEPMFIQPHDPNFVPEAIYPEYIPLEEEHILSAEEQPLPLVVSPTVESRGYVAELDPEEDPGEHEDDEIEDEDDEDEEGEEEEHLALADSAVVIPTDELVSPPERTEPVISLPFTDTATTGARMYSPAALPLPPLPPPLHMPPLVDRRDDILETEMPPRKRLCFSSLGSWYEVGESFTARPTRGRGIDYGFVSTLDAEARRQGIGEAGYGIRDTWIDSTETVSEIAPMIMGEVNTRVTELAELHEHDTHDLYALLEDAQDSRTRISQRVAVDSQRVDLLIEDRIAHQETIQIVKDEAYAAREAWAHSIGLKTLRVMGDMRREMGDMQAELLALREQLRRAGQPGGDARVPNLHDAPRDADRTEGVVSLTRWIEKMESVFQISGCAVENQVKFATCTLLDAALTWLNSQIRSLGPDAYLMTWEVLKKKMTNNVHWTFSKTNPDLYQVVADETKKIDKYVSKLPDNIYESVKASKPKTLDETIELANDLMDQKFRTYAERQSNNKRKVDDSFRNNQGYQQQTYKRQNVAMVYNMGTGERKPYSGNLPKCTKCHFHHNGPCTHKCHKCNKVGHFACDCRSSCNTNVVNAQRNNVENLKGNGCFECGATGHFKRDCPKLKNKDGERSFISTAFSSLIDIILTPLRNSYDVKLADGKIVGISAKKEEDKSKGKQLEDVPVVRDYLEVFPKDLPGLPPARPLEF